MATLHSLNPEKAIKALWFLTLKILVDYFWQIVKLYMTSLVICSSVIPSKKVDAHGSE
jgi:hypothetical protein